MAPRRSWSTSSWQLSEHPRQCTPVNDDGRAGDVAASVARQKKGRASEFFGTSILVDELRNAAHLGSGIRNNSKGDSLLSAASPSPTIDAKAE